MYQIFVSLLLKLFDDVRDLEHFLNQLVGHLAVADIERQASERVLSTLEQMQEACIALEFPSASKQVLRIASMLSGGKVEGPTVADLFVELRRRITEDAEEHVYLCIPASQALRYVTNSDKRQRFKTAAELMHPSVVEVFPSTADDIECAYRCHMLEQHQASMFHLMRVVEAGAIKLAELVGMEDKRPSWGAILQFVEKAVLRTRHQDLSPALQSKRPYLEKLLPQMQAIQRGWRNKFIHVDGKILPDAQISAEMAREIISAVESFMRELAADVQAME